MPRQMFGVGFAPRHGRSCRFVQSCSTFKFTFTLAITAAVLWGTAADALPELAWSGDGTQSDEAYGFSVSTAGDVNGDGFDDLIVGTPYTEVAGVRRGRVWVHHGGPSGLDAAPAWIKDGGTESLYGYSVSCAGDVNNDGFDDVLVGAPLESVGGQINDGRAFLYYGSAAGLAGTPSWTYDGPQAEQLFGDTVAGVGDVNGDGFADFAVGSWAYDSGGNLSSGRAYVFFGGAGGPTLGWVHDGDWAAALMGSGIWSLDINADGYSDIVIRNYNPQFEATYNLFLGGPAGPNANPTLMTTAGDIFTGGSAASAGDVNGDGFEDMIIGDPTATIGSAANAGRVTVVFGATTLPGEVWQYEGTEAEERFGIHVSFVGDANGDGFGDFIASSAEPDDSGRVRLFYGRLDGPTDEPVWEHSGAAAGDDFGDRCAPAGDVNGDGLSDLAFSSPYLDNPSDSEGRVEVFHGSMEAPGSLWLWSADGAHPDAGLGGALAIGDFNGDGADDAVLGNPLFDGSSDDEGQVLVHYGPELDIDADWSVQGDDEGMQLGAAVATALDVNGNGYEDLLVGVPGANEGRGEVRLYYGGASGLSVTPAWVRAGAADGDAFGWSVSSAGDLNADGYADVIVGSPARRGAGKPGRVDVFFGSSVGLTDVPQWSHVSPQNESLFGFDVCWAGDVNADGFSDVLVGAPGYDDPEMDEGKTFLFFGSATGVQPGFWTTEVDSPGALHGYSVAGSGDVNADAFSDVVVGSPGFGGDDAGRVDVYQGAASSTNYVMVHQWTASHAGARTGTSVEMADFNLDGRSDVVLGIPGVDNGQVDEGQVWVLRAPFDGVLWFANDGNFDYGGHGTALAVGDINSDGVPDLLSGAPGEAGEAQSQGRVWLWPGNGIWSTSLPFLFGGQPRYLSLRHENTSQPVPLMGALEESVVDVEADLRSPVGRDRLRLEVEIKPFGQPFDGSNTATSALYDTGIPQNDSGSWVTIRETLSGLAEDDYRWRARVLSKRAGVKRSPWFGPARNAAGEMDFRIRTVPASADELGADGGFHGVDELAMTASPTPFRTSTTLRFRTPETGHVRVRIVDASGRLVSTLLDERRVAGEHSVEWLPGRNGESPANGVYFAILEADGRKSKLGLIYVR